MTDYTSIWMMLAEQEFTQSWRDIDGVRTRIVTAGDPAAQPVVLLHGTGGHWETFAPTLGALSDRYFCIAFDMVGNGFTDKPDTPYEIPVYMEHVRGVMAAHGVSHAHFVGMSLGAWVASSIAVFHPELVDKLVLMSPAGLIATQENMARIRAERTRAVENPDWDSIKAMFDNLIADESRRLPDLIGLRQAIYRRADTYATIDHLLALQDAETRQRNLLAPDQWRQIQAPTMVVASGKDHGEYQSTAHQVAALIPDSTVFGMPGVRHWPHFEDPELFNPALVEFLGGDR
ncbi:alpha/beta fold hydrolase [Microbacterium immunditiarum]|uniref:Pimeloyl-ACP methyl ester carboxylesterase n=1 Tax=Microbacterium immunditiarum TaxID=337480 RepID=A0A7Y9GQF3_9MICO|nr:alpha/beta hydrolase [Microbacterium immunditiarum]NYE19655.1 pimeloyl-ACP methyl ester carboxylesterase [Microbacterium immunditiarum]